MSDGCMSDRAGKGNHHPVIHADEKSDTFVVPKKLPNKGDNPAEVVEGREVAKGNTGDDPAHRTQSRASASKGLEGIREIARREKRAKFTALLHHITPSLLVESFYALKRNAAAGVDGVTWRDYEAILYTRVHELHREIHLGAYRAQASRRVYIPKADGKQRPLGIAALEDKIVQQAVATVLNAIYEEDFLGFSYGFRTGRGQHDALDAVTFDFLGFTHCCAKTRQGGFKLLRLTIKKRLRATLAAIRDTLKRRRHEPVGQIGQWLRRVMQGYFNYHAVPGNLQRLEGFRSEVCRAWRQALCRRSQRHNMTWERFSRLIQKFIPRCRQVHPYPSQRFRVIT